VVGIGDDGPEGLTRRALDLVQRATLLCGGTRHLAFFPDHAAERFEVRANLDALLERLAHVPGSGHPVVLASGDPCFFGIAPLLSRRLGSDRVRIEPHVGSVQLAFARLAESWQDATVVSAHGRPLAAVLSAGITAAKVAFLTDEHNTPAAVARALMDGGREDCTAHVFEHLGGARERHTACRLSDLPQRNFEPLNVLVLLGAVPALETSLRFGRADDQFRHRGSQITKAEVRAISISKLALPAGGVLWDVGAGCGALSVETTTLVPSATIYAVERDDEQLSYLRDNVRTARVPAVQVVAGEAPEALLALPDPDAVFVGGSGGQLPAILEQVATRLRPHGRLVANFATLEHVVETQAWLRERGWKSETVQVNIARAQPLAGLTRWAPLAPVFVVAAQRPLGSAVL
jgi:precorrin-6Y C5,15-methyltransferase (decarboxylating)